MCVASPPLRLPMHVFSRMCGQEFGPDVITDDLSEYIAIALLLVSERAKGKASFWKSYIEVLPSVEEVSNIRRSRALAASSIPTHIIFFQLFFF